MRRDVSEMAGARYDLLVVGGGIHGACAAWEGARRRLRVALIEAADFGHATSSNSLRTFHGGIRYLQQLDLARMRQSICERREWLRLAPHLVRPMRFVLPTIGHALRGPETLRAALFANDLIGIDRNAGVLDERRLPRSELWSRERTLQALAGTEVEDCNGAAAWYDAVCTNTERLQLAVLDAAEQAGARIANYVRALQPLHSAGRVSGIRARDEITRSELDIRAGAVINAAGPWVSDWLPAPGVPSRRVLFHASKAFNLITRRLPFADALGLACPQTYFVIPWNGYSLIGTRHIRCERDARFAAVTPDEVEAFLCDLNRRLGAHRLSSADVIGVFAGLLPERADACGSQVSLDKTARVIDHSARDGLMGVYSIVGIKWTTARAIAERTVETASRRSHLPMQPPAQRIFPPAFPQPETAMRARSLGLGSDAIQHLTEMYGGTFEPLLALIDSTPTLAERITSDSPVMKAQIVYAVRTEMACRLADVVRRRTPLYLSEALDISGLRACASLMARELGWSAAESARQIEDTAAQLRAFHLYANTNEPLRTAEAQRRGCFT